MTKFRSTAIARTCAESHSNYRDYKAALKVDFHGRCAYCNIHEKYLSADFEIDHYVPRKEFEKITYNGKYLHLETDYQNLVFSCKKCNSAKSGQCDCNLDVDKYCNNLFFNPVLVDYNSIFYRNEYGSIKSFNPKGRDIINRLKLYRIIHNIAWLLEQMDILIDELESIISIETNLSEKDKYKEFQSLALKYFRELQIVLNNCYKSC